MMKKYVSLSLLLLLLVMGKYTVTAQDVHFSQFYENNLLRNPALVGVLSGDYKVGVNYRNQWSTLATPFVTTLISGEAKFLVNKAVKDYVSFGVTGVNYKAGKINFNTMGAYAAINYNKALEDNNNTYLSFGFTGGYIQRTFDISKATFSNQYINGAYSGNNASRENLSAENSTTYDLGVGISMNGTLKSIKNSTYYFGAAAFNILRPSEQYLQNSLIANKSVRWTANLGLRVPVTNQYAITVHGNYQLQTPYNEIVFGALLGWKNNIGSKQSDFTLSAGFFYRIKDAVIPTIKLDYKKLSVNFSYDYAKSDRVGNTSFGSYEISLFIRGSFNRVTDNSYNLRCPRFEDPMVNQE